MIVFPFKSSQIMYLEEQVYYPLNQNLTLTLQSNIIQIIQQ